VSDHNDTVQLVELRELVELARVVLEMRKAQRAYFEARRERPHGDHTSAYRHARSLEVKVDSAAHAALAREQQSLPGMEGGG
jgi:hypothetical protein